MPCAEDCVDALCVGEGEDALCEYVDALEGRNVARTDIKNLWIKKDGRIYKNPLRELKEPDSLPFMDYSIYDERQFLRPFEGRILRSGDYQDKRGCPRRCTYCAYAVINKDIYPGGRIKFYSADRFAEEAKYLKQAFNLEFFKIFSEDIFLRPEDDLARMSELYSKKVGLPFTTSAHPLSITEKKAGLLKKMNCVSVSVALECGNAQYRENMLGRKYTNGQFARGIKILQETGIRAVSLNMIGLPAENRKMIFETIEVNRKVKPDFSDFGCFFPFRGIPLGDTAVRDGFAYPEEIKRSRSDHGKSILHMPNLGAEEINGIMKMHHFYLRYPKGLRPFFKLCERDNFFSDCLYQAIKGIDRILHNLSKAAKRIQKVKA